VSEEKEEVQLGPVAKIIAGVIVLLVFVFIFALPVMLLWNDTLAKTIDGVHEISYQQAACLLMLVWTAGRIFSLARKEDD
jgi:hypothetical protein